MLAHLKSKSTIVHEKLSMLSHEISCLEQKIEDIGIRSDANMKGMSTPNWNAALGSMKALKELELELIQIALTDSLDKFGEHIGCRETLNNGISLQCLKNAHTHLVKIRATGPFVPFISKDHAEQIEIIKLSQNRNARNGSRLKDWFSDDTYLKMKSFFSEKAMKGVLLKVEDLIDARNLLGGNAVGRDITFRDWDYSGQWNNPEIEKVVTQSKDIPSEMATLVDWINMEIKEYKASTQRGEVDLKRNPIVTASIAQNIFVTAHPFVVGNGNLGFELANYILESCELPPLTRNNGLDKSTGFRGHILVNGSDLDTTLEKTIDRLYESVEPPAPRKHNIYSPWLGR